MRNVIPIAMPVELPKHIHLLKEIGTMASPHQNSPSIRTTRARSLAIATIAVLAAACSGDHALSGPATVSKSINISFASIPVLPGAAGQLNAGLAAHGDLLASPGATGNALIATSGNDTLSITKAELVLSKVELTQSTGMDCDDDDQAVPPGCTEIERHFVLVDLPTDTAVQTLINANIPAGTYASLEARLRVPRTSDDSAAAAFLAAHPDLAGANVLVQGTFRGQPFTYLGKVDTRFELTFSPPVTVDTTGVNVTIHVDVTTWFRDGTGALLDPSTANSGGANAALVTNNIQRSFRAVRDDERDGHDHGGDDGSHSGPGKDGNGGGGNDGSGHH
jgi:hypothetical protein